MNIIGSLRELESDHRVICLVGVKEETGLSQEEVHNLLNSLDFTMEMKDLQKIEITVQEKTGRKNEIN
jgi:hypothetical protein